MQGRRLPDMADDHVLPSQIQDGDYWKSLADGSWHVVTPNGLWGWLKNHKVVENVDGSITVPLSDGGKANSILVSNGTGNKSWHGCIENGVWREC